MSQVKTDSITEKVAFYQHTIWSHWMKYLFCVSKRQADGSVIIPKELVDRWSQQIVTQYNDLTEKEKKSDRDQAEIIIKIIKDDI